MSSNHESKLGLIVGTQDKGDIFYIPRKQIKFENWETKIFFLWLVKEEIKQDSHEFFSCIKMVVKKDYRDTLNKKSHVKSRRLKWESQISFRYVWKVYLKNGIWRDIRNNTYMINYMKVMIMTKWDILFSKISQQCHHLAIIYHATLDKWFQNFTTMSSRNHLHATLDKICILKYSNQFKRMKTWIIKEFTFTQLMQNNWKEWRHESLRN